MKNINILVTIALVFSTSILMAQEDNTYDSREELRFGFKAGANYSNVYDEKTDDFEADSKFGFVGGVMLGIPISKYIGLQPEVLFSQKGFKGGGSILGSAYSFKRTTSYIDVPLQIAIKPTQFLTIVAGPQYSFLLSQKDQFESSSVSFIQEEEFKNDNIRKNLLGAVGGIDIHVDNFTIGTRIGWDIQNNNGNGSSNAPRYKNTWYQLTAGYTF